MKITHSIFSAVTLAVASVGSVHAEEPVDEIVVSAARTPLSLSDIGNAVTIIDNNDIAARQALTVADLLRSVPGFSVSRTGVSGSQTQVRVRGAEANQILVLIDGNRANDPATGDEFRWEFLSTAQIERIEIVRGAQSTLWGTDAIGGVVNVITRQGGDGVAGVDGYAEAGSFGTRNLGLNGSTDAGAWQLAGGIERQDTDGANISRTGDEEDGAELTTLFANANWRSDGSLEIKSALRYSDATAEFDAIDFSTGLPADSDSVNETSTLTANVTGRWESGAAGMTHSLSARWFDSDNESFANGEAGISSGAERLALSYQLDIPIGDNGLSLAAEHEQSDFRQRGAVVFGDPNQDQSMDISSLIAEYRGLAAENFSWIASARFDSNSDFDDAFNARLSGAYTLSPTLKLRGSIGTGQKNPTFTERFGFFPGTFVGNPNLEPEESLSIDAGVDASLFDDRLTWQLTVFQQNLENEINGFVFTENFEVTAENQDGDSERQGAEIAAQWQINANIAVDASYTYVDATEPDAVTGGDIDELRRPRHTGALGLSLAGFDGRWNNRLTAEYGGTRLDRFFPPFPTPSEIVTIGNFWLLDLSSQFTVSDALTVYLRGSNLLDEDYEEVFGYQTLGRAGYVGLRFNFGR
ncbi:MAG: TonB-dependent receptor [Pseudomonadota bacterium]